MTHKEAIKEMRSAIKRISDGYYKHIAYGGKANDETENYLDALDHAIKAIEKQIPKKPKDDGWIYCSVCGRDILMDRFRYCPDCGHAIDWRDTE